MSMLALLLTCVIVYKLRGLIKGLWLIFVFCLLIGLFGKTFIVLALIFGAIIEYVKYENKEEK